jgi:hypothetical protein
MRRRCALAWQLLVSTAVVLGLLRSDGALEEILTLKRSVASAVALSWMMSWTTVQKWSDMWLMVGAPTAFRRAAIALRAFVAVVATMVLCGVSLGAGWHCGLPLQRLHGGALRADGGAVPRVPRAA